MRVQVFTVEVLSMEAVWFRIDTSSKPVRVAFLSGKISFTKLSRLFQLKPESIRLNGTLFLEDS